MKRRVAWLALLALILIATALRLYRLASQDIWGDEAFSIALSSSPLSTVIAGAADTHPPLYPVLLFFWLRVLDSSAFATRALSAFIGTLAVPLLWALSRRLVPSRPRVAWLAALFAAVSPLLIYYSQETRMYEAVAVFSLASAYCLLGAFPFLTGRDEAVGRAPLLAYFLSTLAAIYTHYSAFFVLGAEGLFFVISWWRERERLGWKRLREWVLVQALLILSYVPWILVQTSFLSGKASTRFDEWGWSGVEMIFGKSFLAFGGGLTLSSPTIQIATSAFLVLTVIAVIPALRSGKAAPGAALYGSFYFIVPVFIAWLVNPVMPFFFERYVLVALPGFYLTAALGVDRVVQYLPRPTGAAMGIGILLVAFSAVSLNAYYMDDTFAKGKYGQMMAYVSRQAQPGDALVLNNPLQKPLFEYYGPAGIPAFYLPDGAPLEDPSTRLQLAEIANQHTRLWLVMFGNPAEYDPTGFLARWLGGHAFKAYSQGYVDASLSLYVMPAAGSQAVQRTLNASVGDKIKLTGYDLNQLEITPGQILLLTLHWQASAPVDRSYKVFTHLVGDLNPATQSPVWAQMDGEPAGGSRPTTTWQAGEAIDDLYGLAVPASAPPGDYVLAVGMYDPATMQRLPVTDDQGVRVPDDRVVLCTIRIR